LAAAPQRAGNRSRMPNAVGECNAREGLKSTQNSPVPVPETVN
jgi:hypothetical protein